MRAACALAVAAALVGLAAGPACAADYSLDPTHTTVHIELLVPDVPVAPDARRTLFSAIARIARSEGTLSFDRAARSGQVTIRLPAAAIDTGVPAIDALLRGPAVLDAAAHPLLSFTSSVFRFDGDRVASVVGTLTVKGRDTPLTLNAVRFNCYLSPLFRREVCGGDFQASIDVAALGLGEGSAFLRVQVEAIKL